MFLRLTNADGSELNLMVDHIVGFAPVAEGADTKGSCNVMLSTKETVVIDETARTLRSRIKKAYSTFGATETAGDEEEDAAPTPAPTPAPAAAPAEAIEERKEEVAEENGTAQAE